MKTIVFPCILLPSSSKYCFSYRIMFGLIMGILLLFVVNNILAQSKPFETQVDEINPRIATTWVHLEQGYCNIKSRFNDGYIFSEVNMNVTRNKKIYHVGFGRNIPIYQLPTNYRSVFSALNLGLGTTITKPYGNISLLFGISALKYRNLFFGKAPLDDRFYDMYRIGIFWEMQLIFKPVSPLGIGIKFGTNINVLKNLFVSALCLQFSNSVFPRNTVFSRKNWFTIGGYFPNIKRGVNYGLNHNFIYKNILFQSGYDFIASSYSHVLDTFNKRINLNIYDTEINIVHYSVGGHMDYEDLILAYFIGPSIGWGYNAEPGTLRKEYLQPGVYSGLQLIAFPHREIGLGCEIFANFDFKNNNQYGIKVIVSLRNIFNVN